MEYFQICFQFTLMYLDSGCEVLVKRMQILNFVSTKSSWKTNLTHSCIYFILKQDSQKIPTHFGVDGDQDDHLWEWPQWSPGRQPKLGESAKDLLLYQRRNPVHCEATVIKYCVHYDAAMCNCAMCKGWILMRHCLKQRIELYSGLTEHWALQCKDQDVDGFSKIYFK